MILEKITVGSLEANCYMVGDDDTKEIAVIDPGSEEQRLFDIIQRKGYIVKYIVATHGHVDHISAIRYLKEKTEAPVMIHSNDSEFLMDSKKNLSSLLGFDSIQVAADMIMEDSMVFSVGQYDFKVIHTPGHTQGGICILLKHILFSGDTLFEGSIGRADLPGGNYSQLLQSIQEKLLVLPEDTIVYPGHGEETTIKQEKAFNPFL
ncbi:MAG: MBL fold metallo-hydrolase [Clostridia bacterium]